MKVILTGSTGFLGAYIKKIFAGEQLTTVGRREADIITDFTQVLSVLPQADLVIHAAGKAHLVPRSDEEKESFYVTNVTGTKNLLNSLVISGLPNAFVFISSVAVYGLTTGILINEEYPLEAHDPYGMSKIKAEKLIQEWCMRNDVKCFIFRLPLIIGSNPPGNLKSMIGGIKKGYYRNIGDGHAKKSMVLAEDVASILPLIPELKPGIYNLTDSYHPSFNELSSHIAGLLGKKNHGNIPLVIARLLALAGNILGKRFPINSDKLKKIISTLTFDDSKAVELLHWKPKKILEDSSFIK